MLICASAMSFRGADAQTFSARRMAMGGVVLGGNGANVAYRAVPQAPSTARSLSLPLGLIPLLADPPQLDSSKPDFNIYELANLLYNVPWNLQISEPAPISSDVTISISQNSLAVDLGEVKNVFPADHSKIGAVLSGPSVGFGIKNAFAGIIPVIHYENDISLNTALHDALHDARPFVPNTEYAMFDKVRAQAAVGAELGYAMPVMRTGAHPADRNGLYVGSRVKLLRGLAYGDADNKVGFVTGDTLFTNPVNINYVGLTRRAGPENGGWGEGLDLGAVWVNDNLELGLGVNDVVTRINWKVRESVIYNDTLTSTYVEQVLRDNVPYRSRIPAVVTLNAALQLGRWLVAGDIVNGVNNTQGHVGAEIWQGPWALRAGAGLDATQLVQGSCGAGYRFGRLGLDLALTSHSRNLTRERALELGAGLSFYR
jgi:hypothetical protein